MNIRDVDRIPTVKGDKLEMIWERQRALHEKYKEIEVRNGCGYYMVFSRGFHIDDARSQYYIKDMVWRVTEELAEASEAFLAGDYEHGQEEVADAFHFLVEMCIIIGLVPEGICKSDPQPGADRLTKLFNFHPRRTHTGFQRDEFSFMVWYVVEQLGLACNCLKNKPWKATHMETDKRKMNRHVKEAFYAFIRLSAYVGLGPDELFETYFKKSEVNKFRQRSNY